MADTTDIPMISKSQFIRGLQCHKSLWLYRNRPMFRAVAAVQEEVFASGTEIGQLARKLFPGGIEIHYGEMTLKERIAQTQRAMQTHKVIYEATFEHDGILVTVDILKKGPCAWELYEVKSSISTKGHLDDVAILYYVLTGAGVCVSKVGLVHLDINYVRKGAIDPQRLFAVEDLTQNVLAVQKIIAKQVRTLKRIPERRTIPAINIGPHCDDPNECEFKPHCWAHIPEFSVFSLAGRNDSKKLSLYWEGIVALEDVPLEDLCAGHRRQVEAYLDKRVKFNVSQTREFLKELWYPLCFLALDTFQSAIPPFDDISCYGQIPFQYSLHTLKRKRGKLQHTAFLGEPNKDPREALLDQLFEELPDDACILTYNKSFEIDVLERLAEQFPNKRKNISKLINNVRDLIVPFRDDGAYHWRMQASYSIKKVLPAFVPDLSYDGLEVRDGDMAMKAWQRMRAAQSAEELTAIRKNLRSYCSLNTLAMVKLLEVLEKAAREQ